MFPKSSSDGWEKSLERSSDGPVLDMENCMGMFRAVGKHQLK